MTKFTSKHVYTLILLEHKAHKRKHIPYSPAIISVDNMDKVYEQISSNKLMDGNIS
uniref:Uncharacterized protein n=1 Tax=Arion vulgaris TaxID=1028688 RepID=A0A0B7A6A0_9EUPU